MKKTAKIFILLTAILLVTSPCFAVSTTSGPINMSATIVSDLSLSTNLQVETQAPGAPLALGPATSMDFGNLIRSSTNGVPNALRSDKVYHVFLGVNTSGRSYNIKSTMNAMGTLPHAVGVFPVSAKKGDGTAEGGTLASNQDAIGTGKTLYTSSASANAATVELVYGLSGGNADGSSPFTGWQPVPPDQAANTYSSSITYTLTA